jgi:hypothetical protein
MTRPASPQTDGFHLHDYNQARPFASFLPGIAGEYGKPMWVFYANRGQCISSFGVRDRNSAMLEFQPANKANVLTPLLGFRSFFKVVNESGCMEAFLCGNDHTVAQRLVVRPEEVEIEETNVALGLRIRVVYFTLPNEKLPALVRHVAVENISTRHMQLDVLDGLPQIVPFGLEEKLLKQMSRTMEAFAEIRHVEDALPFYKLKVEPSDKAEVSWIDGGFFAFTLHDGKRVPVITDPDLVFGSDTSLRSPLPFARGESIDPLAARRDTLTGCAFAALSLSLEPGASATWTSFFGQADSWDVAAALRSRAEEDVLYVSRKRNENTELITRLSAKFSLIAGPPELGPYTRQAFLDNSLRGGQPVVIEGPRGPRVFHTFTRKHGDTERDYNLFELAPTYWSQGNGNFRDVNQNRRCENFIFPGVDASNIETFFNLIQLDGNNPLVIQAERFQVPPDQFQPLWQSWLAGDTAAWRAFLAQPFNPGQLLEALITVYGTPQMARPWFDLIIGRADKIQDAAHGEGYWVDHWIYNLDLIDSYAALYPDRMRALMLERADFSYFDNDHVVQPRDKKYMLRADRTVRQLHAVVRDAEKTRQIAQRTELPQLMRAQQGKGAVYRTTLLAKVMNLLAVKASLFDPAGVGLEMETEKPGWCDALNGLPGLIGSSTHEAFALQRGVTFARRTAHDHLNANESLAVPMEVAEFVRSLTEILERVDPQNFFPTWNALASRREAFRAETRLGVQGNEVGIPKAELLRFFNSIDAVLTRGLALAVDSNGLPISYYTHEMAEFDVLPPVRSSTQLPGEPTSTFVQARRFVRKPIAAFLEGAVQALRSIDDPAKAQALHSAVRASKLYDEKLGMYRVNAPLDQESFEIGRSRIFSPGWLENESIFLHMHYKFLLETLRSGAAQEFYVDLRRGLVAFHDPAVYGRSPLENSSFIASSRFPDAKVHGVGFVARLSGATAEWISMVLHMGLGATPFRLVDGALRFEPRPVLADWLFTEAATRSAAANSFGFKLFGNTWVVYENPKRASSFGIAAVAPTAYELHYADGGVIQHLGSWLPASLATDLRACKLARLTIQLG